MLVPAQHERFAEALQLLCHDLRSPLAAILTNLEFATQQIDRESADIDLIESLDDAVVSCVMLRRLVANLDVLIRSSATQNANETSSPNALVAEVVKQCEPHATLAGVTIETRDHQETGQITCDRRLVALALENLVANAIQYAPRKTTIDISIENTDKAILVHVEDDGGAIAAPDRNTALSLEAHTEEGRLPGLRYGRGLGLLAARIAADLAHVELIIAGNDRRSRLSLKLPA